MPYTLRFTKNIVWGHWLDYVYRYARKYWRFTRYPYAQSQGLMQVSPASVLSDFDTYGQIIYNPYTGSDLIPASRHYRSWYVRHVVGWYGNGAAHTVCPWQSIPIVRFEYQSLSTQTQSWSCDVGMVRRSVGESRQ
jgi:hypothetical protein